MSATPNAMTTDPNDGLAKFLAWLYQLGAVGVALGGLLGAALAKYHEYRSSRHKSWVDRKKDLRQMLQEIRDEDTLKSVLRHERTHWQRQQKDEAGE
jgi:hypothetical protein